MPNNVSQKIVPGSTLAVASLLIGLIAAKGVQPDQKADPASPSASVGAVGAPPLPGGSSADRGPVLRPLREALFGEGTSKGAKDSSDIKKRLDGPPKIKVGCFVAMVPDPVETSLSFRFDETIDSIERALGTRDYVLERWRLPWAESGKPDFPRDGFIDDVKKLVSDLAKSPPTRPSANSSKPHPTPGDPGLLVFREQPNGRKPGEQAAFPGFILVFLITETPTQGIDRLALSTSLDLAEEFRDKPAKDEKPKAIQILGPCFSGSMPSLRDSLLDWVDRQAAVPAPSFQIRVVSGTATTFDKKGFERAFNVRKNPPLATAEFSSMVHRTETVLDAILKFLGEPDGKDGAKPPREPDGKDGAKSPGTPEDVAILSEINTAFGEFISDSEVEPGTKEKDQKARPGARLKFHRGLLSLQYPLHIAEIRARYESQGLLQDGAADIFKAAGELHGKGDAKGKVRDVLPDQTSESTAVAEDRMLTQTLKYLEDSRFKTIGIISTDPHDAVFLARLIRRYCPDARVFTVSSDLIYLDPASISDLRGMIVGATYPLYAPNHLWSGSDPSSRGQVFPSGFAQGVFNAAILEAARMTDGEERKGLLEYAMPLSLQPKDFAPPWQPPVWISVVGERSLYPIDCQWPKSSDRDQLEETNYLAQPVVARPTLYQCGLPTLKINRVSAWIVFFGITSLILFLVQANRLRAARSRPSGAGAGNEKLRKSTRESFLAILIRCCIFAGYLYVSCPLLASFPPWRVVDLNLDRLWLSDWFYYGLCAIFLRVVAAVISAPIEEGRSGRRATFAVGVEAVAMSILLLVAIFGAVVHPPDGARWPLSLDRSAAITGGVSAYVPAWFMMGALASWLYARSRIRELKQDLGLPSTEGDSTAPLPTGAATPSTVVVTPSTVVATPSTGAVNVPASWPYWPYERDSIRKIMQNLTLPSTEDTLSATPSARAATPPTPAATPPTGAVKVCEDLLKGIEANRESFESWFEEHPLWAPGQGRRSTKREPWKAGWVWVVMIVLPIGTLIDAAWFRSLSWSDEGRLFDWVFRIAFGVVFFLFCTNFARLASAWLDLRAALSGLAKVLDGAFKRIPKDVSTWFVDSGSCKEDYRLRILRKVDAIRSLLDRWPTSGAASASKINWMDGKIREHLKNLETGQDGKGNVTKAEAKAEIESIDYFSQTLAVHWAAEPIGQHALSAEEEEGRAKAEKEGRAKAGPTLDDQIIARLEELLALHASRWIGGALGRVWTLIGSLVVSSLALLFAITSYPFPEQDRVMTVLGLAIAGLLVLIVRVVIGINRDEVISRVGDTPPGQITWDSALFGHLGAFVIPLIGVLAAISFDTLDLFRAVLGPILRLFP